MNVMRDLWKRGTQEIAVLAGLGVAALGGLSFAYIAEETFEGETRQIDEAWLLALRATGDRADPIGPRWFELAIADITSLGGYAVLTLLVIAVAAYLLAIGKRTAAVLVVGSVASGTVLSETLKLGFARPRPDLVAHLAEVQSGSFPSGHAMLSAITYLTLGALLARFHKQRAVKGVFLALAVFVTLIVGASRVYLGVHWPTDVLAGWSLGAAWAALWWVIAGIAQPSDRSE